MNPSPTLEVKFCLWILCHRSTNFFPWLCKKSDRERFPLHSLLVWTMPLLQWCRSVLHLLLLWWCQIMLLIVLKAQGHKAMLARNIHYALTVVSLAIPLRNVINCMVTLQDINSPKERMLFILPQQIWFMNPPCHNFQSPLSNASSC